MQISLIRARLWLLMHTVNSLRSLGMGLFFFFFFLWFRKYRMPFSCGRSLPQCSSEVQSCGKIIPCCFTVFTHAQPLCVIWGVGNLHLGQWEEDSGLGQHAIFVPPSGAPKLIYVRKERKHGFFSSLFIMSNSTILWNWLSYSCFDSNTFNIHICCLVHGDGLTGCYLLKHEKCFVVGDVFCCCLFVLANIHIT